MSGVWGDTSKWSTEGMFYFRDSATISATGSAYTVSLDSAIHLDTLTLDSADATLNLGPEGPFGLWFSDGSVNMNSGTITGSQGLFTKRKRSLG